MNSSGGKMHFGGKNFLGIGKKGTYLLLGFIFAGIFLRAYFFGSTDITWDEAFHIMLGYKMGAILLSYPVIALALLAAAAALVYFSAVKPNAKILAVFAAAGIIAVYVFSASPVL